MIAHRQPLLLACLVLVVAGCEPDCPGPDEIDGGWDLTAVVLEHTGGDEPSFPSYRSPANGTHPWTLQWGDAREGPVSVSIGDQVLDGSGRWSEAACGAFVLHVDGRYLSPSGSQHRIDGSLDGVLWEGALDGTFVWSERWTHRSDGETGVFTAQGRFDAVRR